MDETTTNRTGIAAPEQSGVVAPAFTGPIASDAAPIVPPPGVDPIVDGLNAALAQVQTEIGELHAERAQLLRKMVTDPRGASAQLKPVTDRLKELNVTRQDWLDALDAHLRDQTGVREKARRDAAREVLVKVSQRPQELQPLAANVDACMASTLAAWQAYIDHGAETWEYASSALQTLQGDSSNWEAYLDACLRHSGPCMGNGPAAVDTLGRFIWQLIGVVGGNAHLALNDPSLAYRAGPTDLADVAAVHGKHIAIHFSPRAPKQLSTEQREFQNGHSPANGVTSNGVTAEQWQTAIANTVSAQLVKRGAAE